MRTQRALGVVAPAIILLLLVAAGVILMTSPPRLEVKVVDNPLVNPPGIIDANNSPNLVRNPLRPASLAVAQRVDRPRFSGAIEWSGDSGTTWQHTALPLPAGLDRPYAPDIAFGPDGTLYVLYVNLTGPGTGCCGSAVLRAPWWPCVRPTAAAASPSRSR